ncbi:hypothetical protein MNB_SV-15-947 [hydrothermal vent metagenome]|uniref:Prepilin-type N-terminal cleavage/methylation domain-containing protein n=1 Tax=hydrothermal vent metagenome TaxID=652676 RepID=A0A1W1EKI7_9ZZZZ
MRHGFTLIEILVVITMMSILMMLIAPAGVKIIESIDNFIYKKKLEQSVEKLEIEAFLYIKEINSTTKPILKKFNIDYISSKAVLHLKDMQ